MRSGVTQSSPTANPLVRVIVYTDTFYNEGQGPDDRLVSVTTEELIWGGDYSIYLDNSDGSLNGKDYEGRKVQIYWSFSGETGSTIGKLWVDKQRSLSREGKLLLELRCIDIWGLMSKIVGMQYGSAWNQPWQNPSQLAGRVLPETQELIPNDLVTKLGSHWNKTIQEVCNGTITQLFPDISISWDDIASDNYIINERPVIAAPDPRSLIAQAFYASKSYLLWKVDDKLHQITPEVHGSAYTYSSGLYHNSTVGEETTVIPNRVVVWYIDDSDPEPSNWTWAYKTAVNSSSYSRLGYYIDEHLNTEFELWESLTPDEAQDRANARLAKLQLSNSTGQLEAPMHCSQELFDAVTIYDNRYTPTKVITGYVFGIKREYDRGVYKITLQLGGVESGYTPDGGTILNVTQAPDPAPPAIPDVDWEGVLPKAVQGYHHDIHFDATDWQTVTWTSGTIKFYDGSTQSIASGQHVLSSGDIHYIYFDLDSLIPTVLEVTDDYVAHMTTKTGLLCLIQRGSNADYKACVLPSYGKEPLITPDWIDMTGLKEYDYGDGKKLQALLSTQIQAGHIHISEETFFAAGYDPNLKENQIHRGSLPPSDTTLLWLDTSVEPNVWKRWNGYTWVLASHYNQDDLQDGAVYGRIRTTDISGGHIKLESVLDGGGYRKYTTSEYNKLLGIEDYADQTAGHSLSVLTDRHLGFIADDTSSNRHAVTGEGKSGAEVAYDIFFSKLTAYGLNLWTSNSSTRVELTANGLRGYNGGILQCEIRATDGKIYAAAGDVILDTNGVTIKGERLTLVSPDGGTQAQLWADNSGYCRLDSFFGTETRDIFPHYNSFYYCGMYGARWRGVYGDPILSNTVVAITEGHLRKYLTGIPDLAVYSNGAWRINE